MAIIDARGGGIGETLLNFFMQREQLELQKKAQQLQERQVKIQEQEAARQAQEAEEAAAVRAAAQQTAPVALQLQAQQNPAIAALIAQRFPQTQADLSTVGNANVPTSQTVNQPFNAANLSGPQALALQQNLLGTRQLLAEIRQGESGARVAEGTEGSRISEAGAQARISGSTARVAEATEQATVENANLAPEERQSLIDLNRARLRAVQMVNERDPARVSQAFTQWSRGQISWGEAREAAGLAPGGIDDDAVFVPPESAAGRLNEQTVKAQTFLPLMIETNQNINRLYDQGNRVSMLGALNKAASSGTLDAFINGLLPSEEQQIIQAQRAFSDMYRFSLSGQQSSDQERAAMMLSITETVNDSAETIAQKRRLRDIMIETVRKRAAGEVTNPVAEIQRALQVAETTGNEQAVSALQSLLQDAIEDQNGAPSNVPGVRNNPGGAAGIVDNVLRGGGNG